MSQNGFFKRLVNVKVPKMDPEFEKTYQSYYPKLFRIATKILQDSEDAKDVVQEVFTAYYFAMNNEKVIRDTKNWLVRSTINKGIDYKRKTAPRHPQRDSASQREGANACRALQRRLFLQGNRRDYGAQLPFHRENPVENLG